VRTLDLKRQHKRLYQPSAREVVVVDVPRLQFAMVDGAIERGEVPGTSPGFASAVQALYGVAYTLKFMLKKRPEDPVDYPVMALEGLWWVEDGRFDLAVKDNWSFTLMILQPEVVTPALFAAAVARVSKKQGASPALDALRLAPFTEGLCVQAMHVGPYAAEPATVERMRAFMAEQGLRDLVGEGGKHHEIYLGDPRRAAPEKLRTVLRHPVAPAG